MRDHRRRQLEQQLRAGPAWSGEWGLVFASDTGRPLSGSDVTHRFQTILARTGMRRQRFHDLRHCAATFMLVQGVPLRVVQEVLGHANITVTANTYTHVLPELQRDAADRMGALLWANS